MIENEEIYRVLEKTIARFHCTVPLHGSIATIMKMEISILYHVIVNSQSNRDDLTRCYINIHISQLAALIRASEAFK